MLEKQEGDTYMYIIQRQSIYEFRKPFMSFFFYLLYLASYLLFHCEHCKHGGLQRCQAPSQCPKIGSVPMLN